MELADRTRSHARSRSRNFIRRNDDLRIAPIIGDASIQGVAAVFEGIDRRQVETRLAASLWIDLFKLASASPAPR